MTTLLIVLLVVLAAALGVAATMWRLLRPRLRETTPAQALASLGSSPVTYRPMSRLFAAEDFAFLSLQPGFRPGLERQLRRQRRRALRLYLREIRIDFDRIYLVCRMLAPHSANPNFASWITQQALSFYGVLAILEVRCALGWLLPVRIDSAGLVQGLERLREAAHGALTLLAPQPVAA